MRGRHLTDGVPRSIEVTDQEIRTALKSTVDVLVGAIRDALERIPPELSADIYDRGIVITGGGSMLRNLDRRIADDTQLPVQMAEDPLTSVVLGAGKMLADLSLLKNFTIERARFEFRGEAYNILNHANFGLPGATLGTPAFGVITRANAARAVQLGLRIAF